MQLTCFYISPHEPTIETIACLERELDGLGSVHVVQPDGRVADAAVRCVDATTPYTLVVTDNVCFVPGTVRTLLRNFRWRRALQRNLYKLACSVRCPLSENAYPGLVALYWTDAISQIGTVDVPTAPMPTEYRALIFGYRASHYPQPIGWIEDRDPKREYHRWFWARIRYRLGLYDRPVPSVTEHVLLYGKDNDCRHLYAAAGIEDANRLRPKVDLVDDCHLGPIGQQLAFVAEEDEPMLADYFRVSGVVPRHAVRRRAA